MKRTSTAANAGLAAAMLLAFATFGHFVYFDDYQPRPLLPYPKLGSFFTDGLPAEIHKMPQQ